MQNLNNKVFYYFYNFSHQSDSIDQLIIFLAHTLPYLVIVSAFIYLLLHHDILKSKNPFESIKQKWREVTLAFVSGAIAWCAATIFKFVFHANRPYLVLNGVEPLISKTDYSFPSGHATFFMALGVAIYLSHKKAGYIFILFALLIGLARIALGVHFPADILGGFILGGLTVSGIRYYYKSFREKR